MDGALHRLSKNIEKDVIKHGNAHKKPTNRHRKPRASIMIDFKKNTRISPKLSTSGGTSDARFIRKIAPCLEFGLVNKTMHRVDECVSLTDLRKLTKIYNDILIEYFK